MHGVLAFLAGVSFTIAALLFVLALTGITYYGITPQEDLALALIAIIVAVIIIIILYLALKSRSLKIETGKEALVGSTGKAATDLNPNGTVRVNGEFWQATTKAPPIKEGTAVKVTGMEGMFLTVEQTEEKA
jgi:membrane-bound serine protease (ClpP class)